MAESSDAEPGGSAVWRSLAENTASELKERLGRYAQLSEADRERLAKRLRIAIDAALEVPDGLPDRVAAAVERLRRDRPNADPVALAWRRTRQRARRTAAIGAVTTVPAMAPGLGPALAALGLVADWRFVAEQQRDLVLEIASLFEVELKNPTQQVRALFLASTATAFGATAAGEMVVQGLARQIARRSLARIVPGAGAMVAGALNYVSTVALGRAAVEHFAERAGLAVEGLVPQRVHPAMPWLRNRVVHAVEMHSAAGFADSIFSDQDRITLAELSRENREELLDLAATAAGCDGVLSDEDRLILAEVADALGFSQAELERAELAAVRDAATSAHRVTRLLARARGAGGRTSRALWHRATLLARGKRRKDRGR